MDDEIAPLFDLARKLGGAEYWAHTCSRDEDNGRSKTLEGEGRRKRLLEHLDSLEQAIQRAREVL